MTAPAARKPAWLLIALAAFACTREPQPIAEPTPADDDRLIADVGFDRGTMLLVRTSGRSFERMLRADEGQDELVPGDGVVLLTDLGRGRDVLRAVRDKLAGSPYTAYLYDEGFGRKPDRIAVVKGLDEYGYLDVAGTDGINHGLDHAKVVERYRAWDGAYGLELVGAGQDWLEAAVTSPPSDWLEFAKEVYAFCPDVVDQGTNDVDELARTMRESRTLYLWWD